LSRFQTQTATLKKRRGTYAYMAPENINPDTIYTAKADVYSLGIIIWETVTRLISGCYEKPFKEYSFIDSNHIQVLFQAKTLNRRPTIRRNTPPSLLRLIEECWCGNPSERPEMTLITKRLEKIMAEYEGSAQTWDAWVFKPRKHTTEESSDSNFEDDAEEY